MIQTKFKDLGICPIKCENKQGTDKLKELHYSINDLLYKYQMRYTLWGLASFLEDKLITYGKELNNLEVPSSAEAKKQEIITQLRKYVLKLRQYTDINGVDPEEEQDAAVAIQKFCLSNYIKQKDNLSTEEIIKLLKDNKELYDNGIKTHVTQPFKKMQDELLEKLNNSFNII